MRLTDPHMRSDVDIQKNRVAQYEIRQIRNTEYEICSILFWGPKYARIRKGYRGVEGGREGVDWLEGHKLGFRVYKTALNWLITVAQLLFQDHDALSGIHLTSFVASQEFYSLANSHSKFGIGRGMIFFVFRVVFLLIPFLGGRIREYVIYTTYSNSQKLVLCDPAKK